MTGRDNDPVRLRPPSPTEDTPDLCSLLFPDRHDRDRLGTTDWDARSVRDRGSGGADKVRRSSQPQYRGPYPTHLQDSTVGSYQKDTL